MYVFPITAGAHLLEIVPHAESFTVGAYDHNPGDFILAQVIQLAFQGDQ